MARCYADNVTRALRINDLRTLNVSTLPQIREVEPMGTREFHERMGKVWNQPVDVTSFTNKRITVNFRAPVEALEKLLPNVVKVDEISSTEHGMISMCACDFWVTRIGLLPVPDLHANEMLCRVSAIVRKDGADYRAYYTLRSDSSSRLLGTLGRHFSHFRKNISPFQKIDDGNIYELRCQSGDSMAQGHLRADLSSISKDPPETTIFGSIDDAIAYVYEVDGSCGYSFSKHMLSFQRLTHPDWDISFCHDVTFEFSLLDYIFEEFGIAAEFDCALYMQNTGHQWTSSWLYRPEDSADHREVAAA